MSSERTEAPGPERAATSRGPLGRLGLTEFLRIVDRGTVRRLRLLTALAVVVALLEVAALLAVSPLIELLSGTPPTDPRARRLLEGLGASSLEAQAVVLLLLVVVLMVARAVLGAAVRWWTIGFVTHGAAQSTTDLLVAYLDAPLSFHGRQNSARCLHTASYSLSTIFNRGLLGLTTMISELTVVVLVCAMLAIVSPLGSLFALVYFGTAALVFNRSVQRRATVWARRSEEIRSRWLTVFGQALGGLREIRLRGAEPEFVGAFDEIRAEQTPVDRRVTFSGELGRYALEAVFMIGFGLLGVVVLLTQGGRSASVLGVLLLAGLRLLPSVARILAAQNSIRIGQASAATVVAELDAMGRAQLSGPRPTRPVGEPAATPGDGTPLAVELRDVTFTYPGSQSPAVDSISGAVAAGGSLGIVGPTGAGKSTVVDLLCGLLTPSAGAVLLDGHPTDAAGRPWQRRIAYVPQDVFLLDASIGANIAFTAGAVDHHALQRATALAQLDGWIAELAEGLDTPVGERGVLVSGGQRQRIGVARALYRRPSLLILDEATSALDVETEAAITDAIDRLSGGVTLVVVAHRLSTVRHCEQIVLLEDGRCAGWGSFDELSRSNRRFAHWVELAGMAPASTG